MQQDTPPRLSQRPTQPMELALTPTKDKGTAGKIPPRHSQETTQPAISQLVELYTQYRERHDNEEELITEFLTQYRQTGEGQSTASSMDNQPVLVAVASAQYQQTGEYRMAHTIDTAQPTHLISSTEDADMQPSPATPRPDAHVATPRRSIGGRCRKWGVSTTNEQTHLPTQTTRSCSTPPNHPKETSLHYPKETSTNNFTTASPTHPLNKPFSSHNPLHTLVHTSCQPRSEAYEI